MSKTKLSAEEIAAAMNAEMPSEEELAARCRRELPTNLKSLANIAYNGSDPIARENARKNLEECLLRMKQLNDDPNTRPEIRHDIENALRQFRHS